MDDIDLKLIALLRENARQPVSSLAQQLHLSRATVRTRIDRLLATRVIKGFTIVTPTQAASALVQAIVLLRLKGDTMASVVSALRGRLEISSIFSTNGRWDLVLMLQAQTLTQLDNSLLEIRNIAGIVDSETSILLSDLG